MSSRNTRNSYRIARRAGHQGARPSVSGQAEVEKLATDLPSPPAVAANPTESLLPHQIGQVATQKEQRPDRNGHERITLKSCSANIRQRQAPVKV